MAQRARAGYCPGCAAVTHVAAPPASTLGTSDALKAQGVRLREEFGPRGGRRLVAHRFDLADGYAPESRDWVASTMRMDVPDPPSRAVVQA